MKLETKVITPAMAKVMLGRNLSNRPMRPRVVAEYAKDMAAGRWVGKTGETIKFDTDGNLIDGQHRLNAVMAANRAVEFLVAGGLEKESVFSVIDSGLKRSSGDALHTKGVTNPFAISSIIRSYYALKMGVGVSKGGDKATLTNSQVAEIYFKRPEQWQLLARASQNMHHKIQKAVSQSFIGSLWAYLYDRKDYGAADTFMTNLCEGFGGLASPERVLRNRLIGEAIQQQKSSAKVKYAVAIKAWNLYRENKPCKRLSWDADKEPFPKAI